MLLGDFNGHNDLWGSNDNGHKGELIGGTLKFLSLLVLEINTFFFRKDKFGIILKVIICCFFHNPGVVGL